tara:strand:+ start:38 stop:1324 length:1287 start_codon:yes stop_codon:yes gene_type:complete
MVVAACHNPRRGFAESSFRIKHQKKIIEREAKKTRVNLLGSQKFYVCDSLMQHACEATSQPPKTMLNMMSAAIPPFDNMWIEWDERERRKKIFSDAEEDGRSVDRGWEPIEHPMKMGANAWGDTPVPLNNVEEGPPKIGFHIYSCKRTEGAYYVDIYFLTPQFDGQDNQDDLISNRIGCSPYSLRFTVGDNIGWSDMYGDFKRSAQDSAGKLENVSGNLTFLSRAASVDECVQVQLEEGPVVFGLSDKHESRALDALYLKAGIVSTNAVGRICLMGEMMKHDQSHKDRDEVMNLVYAEARDNGLNGWRGEIRWIVSVLSLLNYSHTVIERSQEPSEAKRRVFGVPVPRNELRVVEIDLPKPRGTVQYEKLFSGSGAKKRRHVRRGHWRRYVHKDGTVSTRWIPEQWVGDASLGTIIHEYELVNKRNKS